MNSIDPASVRRRVLRTGESIPAIGLGTFGSDRFTPDQVGEAVLFALRAGYRLIDCASVYGNEEQVGAAIAQAIKEGVLKREELFVISKVWNDMHGQGDILMSLAKSLRDLRLDYVDAYLVHWPFPNYHAPGCDGDSRNPDSRPFKAEEYVAVWRQMERIKKLGLARHIGMSNMTAAKLQAVLPLCEIMPSLMETELHPSFQQRELYDFCMSREIQAIGYCPLGSPNRPARDTAPGDAVDTALPAIVDIAKARGVHPAEICLKWALTRGQIPIPFTISPAHCLANLRCAADDLLSDDEMNRIAASDQNCRLIKGQVFLWPGADDWRDLWDEDGIIKA